MYFSYVKIMYNRLVHTFLFILIPCLLWDHRLKKKVSCSK